MRGKGLEKWMASLRQGWGNGGGGGGGGEGEGARLSQRQHWKSRLRVKERATMA